METRDGHRLTKNESNSKHSQWPNAQLLIHNNHKPKTITVLHSHAVFYSLAGSCFSKRVNAYMPTCLLLFLKKIIGFMAWEGWYLLSQDQGGCIIPLDLYDPVAEGEFQPQTLHTFVMVTPPSPPPLPPPCHPPSPQENPRPQLC
jgi:hypothetical protein